MGDNHIFCFYSLGCHEQDADVFSTDKLNRPVLDRFVDASKTIPLQKDMPHREEREKILSRDIPKEYGRVNKHITVILGERNKTKFMVISPCEQVITDDNIKVYENSEEGVSEEILKEEMEQKDNQ